MTCVYCGSSNKSGEHLISRAVLEAVFGKNTKNISSSEIFGNKILIDTQHKINDVCASCNSKLSDYDVSGRNLVLEINSFYNATYKTVRFDDLKLGWIIKTHLNFLRLFPDKITKKRYLINDDIYLSLVSKSSISTNLYFLYIIGWEGEEFMWNENDPNRISYFHYTSVHFPEQKIVVSNFRIKTLDTFIFLPSNNNYENFTNRVKSTVVDMHLQFNKYPKEVNIVKALHKGKLNIDAILSSVDLKKYLKRIKY